MSIDNLHGLDFFQIISDSGITFFQILSSKYRTLLDKDFVGMIFTAIQSFSKEVFKSEVREIVLKTQVIQLRQFDFENNLGVTFHFIAAIGYPLEMRDPCDYAFRVRGEIITEILTKIENLHLLDNYENSDALEYDSIYRKIAPIFLS